MVYRKYLSGGCLNQVYNDTGRQDLCKSEIPGNCILINHFQSCSQQTVYTTLRKKRILHSYLSLNLVQNKREFDVLLIRSGLPDKQIEQVRKVAE